MKKPRKLLKSNIRKVLQKKVSNLWKEYALKRDKVCRLCGSNYILQVHHIFSRKNKNIFVDVENSITLCRNCHCSATWNDSTKDTIRRKIDPAIYDRLYEQSLIKGSFLSWKSISWLKNQVDILNFLIKEKI